MIPQKKREAHPDDVFVWPDGDTATREEIDRGDYNWKSDDYAPATEAEEAAHWGYDISTPEGRAKYYGTAE
jgi:hypothetical protein